MEGFKKDMDKVNDLTTAIDDTIQKGVYVSKYVRLRNWHFSEKERQLAALELKKAARGEFRIVWYSIV